MENESGTNEVISYICEGYKLHVRILREIDVGYEICYSVLQYFVAYSEISIIYGNRPKSKE